MRCVKLLPAFVLLLSGVASSGARAADAPVCDPSYGSISELPKVLLASDFLIGASPTTALLPVLNTLAGWIEVSVSSEGLRFNNRHPALALPFELARFEIVWVDMYGHPIEETRRVFPSEAAACGLGSLYPGQRSGLFKVPDLPVGANPRQHRLVLRAWAENF